MQTCPACGQENPDGFRLCGMCGAALAIDGPAAREERKVVTVLFTDLVGFTSRAERLDPEDVRATLAPYYARLRSEIERHGGTVEKFIGDAVMAVFGAPVAHEDDAERAVRAALAIGGAIEELNDATPGLELRIRTAVNTGEALVSLGARPAEGEGMVSGDVVNTAARLQTAAPVGGILAGEATVRATGTSIEYREAPPVDAKGKTFPIAVWEVVAARSRFGLDVDVSPRIALIGRERERGFLADALERCRTEQTTQLVTLVGVPGIGKSRLVAELFQIVDADQELIAWRQGRSLPYGESVSYWALGEVVKAELGILESDDAQVAADKLAAGVDGLVPDEAERHWVVGHARPLVGLGAADAAAAGSASEAFAAWRRLLEAIAERGPLVLIFEDLQWADDGLLDFVDHLADWATGVPILIVATARPELLDRRPGWAGGKRNAATISIGPLGDDDVGRLLAAHLERSVLPAELRSRVLASADGNPLYAEEYARTLQDRGLLTADLHGADDIPLPETVQGLIAGRLDSLATDEKELLQNAAVIGKVFWPASLGALGTREPAELEQALYSLGRKEFIRRERRSAVAAETQYAFLHALVRDVTYLQIPRAQRMRKHQLAAAWIESLSPDRVDDRTEMLAHHYREAIVLGGTAGIDTSEVREPARRAFADAAKRAFSLNAWRAAKDWAEQALALTEHDDPARGDVQLVAMQARANLDDMDVEGSLEARDLLLAAGDFERAAEAEVLLAWMGLALGEGSRHAHARRAVELVEARPLSHAKARAYAALARMTSLSGGYAEAIVIAREALAMAEALADDATASHALNSLALSRVDMGDADGIDDMLDAIRRAERASAADELTQAWNNLMNLYWRLGRLDDASAAWHSGRDACTRFGITTTVAWFDGEEMLDYNLRGDFGTSEALAERFLARPDAEALYQAGPAFGVRARARAVQGRTREAVDDARRALEIARNVADPQQLSMGLCYLAFVLPGAGGQEEANALIDELLADHALLVEDAWLSDLPLLLVELNRGDDWLPAFGESAMSLWRVAARAAVSNELERAAHVYDGVGARFHAAWARLLAAERGAPPAELGRARDYFAEQGARGLLRRSNELLPASA